MLVNIQESKLALTKHAAEVLVIRHKEELFTYWDEGTSRYVYVNADETKVIKIEKYAYMSFNKDEYGIYASAEDKSEMAVTELVGEYIEQEFVTPIKWAGKKLTIPQRKFAMSCRNEVGFTKDGKLVCFDLDEFKKY